MDIDFESQQEEEQELSFEEQLDHLEEYDNRTQLRLLITEIEFIMEHGMQPPYDWFERRMDHVIAYSALHWKDLAEEYNEDEILAEGCRRIVQSCVELMNEWSVGPVFDLSTYYLLVHAVDDVRRHYFEHYVAEEEDEDRLFGLISSMERL